MHDNASNKPTSKGQMGTLLKLKNLLKSFGTLVPGSSVPLEMMNQLDGQKVDARIGEAESRIKQLAETQSALALPAQSDTQKASVPIPGPRDWSEAASEFMPRTATLAVLFDGAFHDPRSAGRERFNTVGHGCVIAPNEVMTCREVIDLVNGVASHKSGRGVAIIGMAWYEFEAGPIDDTTGLCVLKLTKRDEGKWARFQDAFSQTGVPLLVDPVPSISPVKNSVMPWIGHEVAFIHTGEAKNASRLFSFEHLQFDATTISHFRKKPESSLKTFVTGVLPGRIVYAGSPVFARDATLLGIVSDTESYPSDSGRRGVVRSLLGHSRFTTFKKI